MNSKRFQIASGSKSTQWFAFGLVGLLLLIPVGLLIFTLPHGLLIFRVPDRGSDRGLIITGDPYGLTINRGDLKPAEARRIDLESDPMFRLTTRTNGIGMPLYQSGWFHTQGAGKALVFASDWSRAVVVPTKLGYSLILTPDSPDLFLTDLAKPQNIDTQFLLGTPENHPSGIPPGMIWLWIMLIGIPTLVGLLVLGISAASRKVIFELSAEGLRINGDLYGRMIPFNSLMIDEAKLVNLKTGPDRVFLWRTNGVGMPGYGSGWHRDGKLKTSYLIFTTDLSRVVRIPTCKGYTLLISPAAPESFLAALRQITS